MADDYSDHPVSLAEIKAEKEHNGSLWSPRDALISLLRDIDSGKANPAGLIVCYFERPEEGGTQTHYIAAGESGTLVLQGCMNRVAYMINSES